jgi:hypothetical protein
MKMDTIMCTLKTKTAQARTHLTRGGVHDPKLIDDIIQLREVISLVTNYEIDLIESNLDID